MDQIEQQQIYCQKIATHYDGLSEKSLQFVFSAFYPPNVWEDAQSVYEIIDDSFTFLEDEIPIVFIGGRNQHKITRKSQPVGFFLTDHTIYVQNVSYFTKFLPSKFPYPTSILHATNILNEAIESFEWEFFEPIFEDKTKDELKHLLLEILTDILTLKKEYNLASHEVKKATTLPGRLIDLNVTKNPSVKLGTQEKHLKHFSKVYKKFNIPTDEKILLAITDSTLMGVYGLVITEKTVYSKDLLEKPTQTNRAELPMNYPITLIEDTIRLSEEVVHILPSALDNVTSIKTLIQEVLNNELSI